MPYALKVMTVAAAVLFPVVLAYQAWTYYTFGHRIGGTSPSPHPPASLPGWPKDDPLPGDGAGLLATRPQPPIDRLGLTFIPPG